jgi:hypothetical protein
MGAGRQLDFAGDLLLCIGNERFEVTPAYVCSHRLNALRIAMEHVVSAGSFVHVRDLLQQNIGATWSAYGHVSNLRETGAGMRIEPDNHIEDHVAFIA